MDQLAANIAAFQSAIAHGEGVDLADDPYRVCYSFKHTIISFKDHPAITGEWIGEILTDEQCDRAGVPRGSRSTAAGRYQIRVATWRALKSTLKLPDFSPASQDLACVLLLKTCGAYALLSGGEFEGAVAAASRIWASFPGSRAGQPIKPMADLKTAYELAGGTAA